jgi:ABC-2 type transport system permease protein
MVAQLLGLKLRMTANMFRRTPWQLFGLIVGIVYGTFLTVLVFGALVAARSASDVELVRSIVVIGGATAVVGFIVLPVLFGADDRMDPRRFALFGISNGRLAASLSVVAVVSIPSLIVAVCSVATIVTWSHNPGSTVVAILCAAVAIATCAMIARVMSSVAALIFRSGRARGFGSVIAVLVMVAGVPIALLLTGVDWSNSGLRSLHRVADWLSWTPLGAVWAAPADASLGQWGASILKLLIAVAFVAVLWSAWRALVAVLLVTTVKETTAQRYVGLGWFGVLPHTPAGAIAARSLTYFARDRRYWVSLLIIPAGPLVAVSALIIAGVPGHIAALFPLPLVCLFLGWAIHNDVAYDSTAVWLHVVSGTRGLADRVGRLLPVLLIGILIIVVGSVLTVIFYGDWDVMPAVIGVSSAVLLIGIGLSSLTSALFPYPATKPNDGPFAQPQTTTAASATIQTISFLAILVLSSPIVALGVLGITDSPEWLEQTLFAGLGLGIVVLVCGVLAGAAAFARRGPEIMAAAMRAD